MSGTPLRHMLIETRLGTIGLAWTVEDETRIVRLALPAESREATEKALLRGRASEPDRDPPAVIAEAVRRILRYADGEAVDFSDLPVLFENADPVRRAIYAALRKVGHGETLTYGELAERAGFPGMAREIGQAMGRNPVPLIIPCHRVVAAGGRLGGFSAPGGTATKERMLRLERALPEPPQSAFAF